MMKANLSEVSASELHMIVEKPVTDYWKRLGNASGRVRVPGAKHRPGTKFKEISHV
jgi:hypothetical protein